MTGEMLKRVVELKVESVLILVIVFQRYILLKFKTTTEKALEKKNQQTDELIKATAEIWGILGKYNSRLSDLFYILQNAQAHCIRSRADIQALLNKQQEDETEDKKDSTTNK